LSLNGQFDCGQTHKLSFLTFVARRHSLIYPHRKHTWCWL